MTPIRVDYVTNEHDKQLIDDANNLHYTDWGLVKEEEAITPEGKRALHNIRTFLFHKEEIMNGDI